MNVTYCCPQCHVEQRVSLDPLPDRVQCSHCQFQFPWDEGAIDHGRVRCCAVCGGDELYVRKDFSQRLGLGIIIAGFVVSSVFWAWRQSMLSYAVLLTTAVLDAVLYMFTGDSLRCYRCQAEYRGFPEWRDHGGFDLEVHERHRQLAARQRELDRSRASGPSTDSRFVDGDAEPQSRLKSTAT